jgi:hypothetical protein
MTRLKAKGHIDSGFSSLSESVFRGAFSKISSKVPKGASSFRLGQIVKPVWVVVKNSTSTHLTCDPLRAKGAHSLECGGVSASPKLLESVVRL